MFKDRMGEGMKYIKAFLEGRVMCPYCGQRTKGPVPIGESGVDTQDVYTLMMPEENKKIWYGEILVDCPNCQNSWLMRFKNLYEVE